MTNTSDPWLFHFTHVDNLPGIISQGLMADGCMPAMITECAEPSIKHHRRTVPVPIGPRGTVADYAPFYFAPRSPMLYRIHKGGVGATALLGHKAWWPGHGDAVAAHRGEDPQPMPTAVH